MEPKTYRRKYSKKAKAKMIKTIMELYPKVRELFYELEGKQDLLNPPNMYKLELFLEGAIQKGSDEWNQNEFSYSFWDGIKSAYSKNDETSNKEEHEKGNLDFICVKSIFDVYSKTSNQEPLKIAKTA